MSEWKVLSFLPIVIKHKHEHEDTYVFFKREELSENIHMICKCGEEVPPEIITAIRLALPEGTDWHLRTQEEMTKVFRLYIQEQMRKGGRRSRLTGVTAYEQDGNDE